MTLIIVLGVLALVVLLVLQSRKSKKTKEHAIEDLAREREAVGTFSIFDLVESEVQDLGLTKIEGAHNIPQGVLLKVWRESEPVIAECVDPSHLRYVTAPGVAPTDATENDVTLECTQQTE